MLERSGKLAWHALGFLPLKEPRLGTGSEGLHLDQTRIIRADQAGSSILVHVLPRVGSSKLDLGS